MSLSKPFLVRPARTPRGPKRARQKRRPANSSDAFRLAASLIEKNRQLRDELKYNVRFLRLVVTELEERLSKV